MWPNPQKLRIWSHLLKKSLTENFIFCAVKLGYLSLQLLQAHYDILKSSLVF